MSLSIFPATPSDTGRLPWALHHTSSSPGWTVPTFPAWLHRRDAPVLLPTSWASFGLGPTGPCPYYVRNTRTLCNVPGGGHPNLKAQFLFFWSCSGFNSQYHQQSYPRDLPKIRQFTSAARCSACIRKQHRVHQHQLDSCNNFPGPRSQVTSMSCCSEAVTSTAPYCRKSGSNLAKKGIIYLWVHSVFSVWLKLPLTLTWATRSYWWVNYTPNRKVVFCSMDLLWWTFWLLHSHVYIFKYFSLCKYLYISAVMMSVWLKSQIKHFSSQNGPKLIFPI